MGASTTEPKQFYSTALPSFCTSSFPEMEGHQTLPQWNTSSALLRMAIGASYSTTKKEFRPTGTIGRHHTHWSMSEPKSTHSTLNIQYHSEAIPTQETSMHSDHFGAIKNGKLDTSGSNKLCLIYQLATENVPTSLSTLSKLPLTAVACVTRKF